MSETGHNWKLILITCILPLTACASINKAGIESEPRGLSKSELANGLYRSEWTQSGEAPLTDGEYREKVAPGSATKIRVVLTEHIAYGDLDGRPAAAAVLFTDPGGSGTFFDLAAMVSKDGHPVNAATTSLGDRVKIDTVAIAGNEIVVGMTTHRPEDPLCCPTQQVERRFALQGDQLVAATRSLEITGTVWKWQQTLYNNDTKAVPQNSANYTFELKTDGKISIRADCNAGGGIYNLKGSQISIEITHTTMAACPPGSLEDKFIKDLNAAAIYFKHEGNLYLDLKYDTGTMKFSR